VSVTILEAQALGKELGLDPIDHDVLLCEVLQKGRTHLIAWPEKYLTKEQFSLLNSYYQRRSIGEPVAYITGVREFWSLPIKTSTATLIPRPDTEILVETVLDYCDQTETTCVDLGTGTGAIALALKSERPKWNVLGLDKVSEAIDLARQNAQNLQLSVSFKVSSWCEELEQDSIDIIISNPPYIDKEDHHLAEGDVRFEPSSALVAQRNGLSDIEIIAQQSAVCLKQGGLLALEHGWKQALDVQRILKANNFDQIQTVKDYGGNDRVTFGRINRPEV